MRPTTNRVAPVVIPSASMNAIANLSASQKQESIIEKESAFMKEFGVEPEYLTLQVGREYSIEICNSKIPIKEYGSYLDAKLAALRKALKDIDEE